MVENCKEYGDAWVAWWGTLQPAWRSPSGAGLPPSIYSMDNEGWDALLKGGRNGFIVVLLAMVSWGRAGRSSKLWRAAVVDVKMCLAAMTSNGTKRKAVGMGGGGGKARRYVLLFFSILIFAHSRKDFRQSIILLLPFLPCQ